MPNPTLLERVEAASGPDRVIDAALLKFFCPGALITQYLVGDDETSVFHAQALGIPDKSDVPSYTASIDAALALVERVLPGWGVEVLASDRDAWRATVWPWVSSRGTRDKVGFRYSYAKSPALALLAALLKAKENDDG